MDDPKARCLLAAVGATVAASRSHGVSIRACVETAVAAAVESGGAHPAGAAQVIAARVCSTLNGVLLDDLLAADDATAEDDEDGLVLDGCPG